MSGRGGSNGSSTQACAACKYQRRKCTPDCILAPYFPPDQQRQFLNAHKLFGVSNILKIIRNLDPLQKAEAMRSIMFQSDARARDPVGGCYRIIMDLQRQLERDTAELDLVLRHLAFYREQISPASSSAAATNAHQLRLNANSNALINNDYNSLQQQPQPQPQQQHYHYRQDFNSWIEIQNQNNNVVIGNNCMDSSSSHATQILVDECDDMKPLDDMFDRKPSYESFPCGHASRPTLIFEKELAGASTRAGPCLDLCRRFRLLSTDQVWVGGSPPNFLQSCIQFDS